ncbi:MAG: hypothetical protein ACYSOS_04755, partial [Planctomycetota bacterium]
MTGRITYIAALGWPGTLVIIRNRECPLAWIVQAQSPRSDPRANEVGAGCPWKVFVAVGEPIYKGS